jgi:DnaD/phage-associated family protein
MAKRRMFSLDIIDTDLFMEMPQTSRLLYYELCMRADDDGFVSSPKKIMKMVGCSEDDFKVLATKQFIIPFDTGIVVIKHWKIHNYIQNDRYTPTIYTEEKKQLEIEKNKMYTKCIQDGYTGKDSIGKISIDKNSIVEVDIYSIIEQNFGRTLNPIEYETITNWNKYKFPLEMLKYATTKAVLKNIYNISYIDKILYEWDKNNIRTLAQAQEEDKKFTDKPKRIYKTRQEKEEEAINKFLSEDD